MFVKGGGKFPKGGPNFLGNMAPGGAYFLGNLARGDHILGGPNFLGHRYHIKGQVHFGFILFFKVSKYISEC